MNGNTKMTLRDSCRVRTADRTAQPRESRSAVRTLQNAKRLLAQVILESRYSKSVASIFTVFHGRSHHE